MIVIGVLTRCTQLGPVEIPPQVQGEYELIYYGSSRIPANAGEIPAQPGAGGSGCFLRLTEGKFTVNPAAAFFRYTYEFRNSCDGRLLSTRDVAGQYSQNGALLTFTIVGPAETRTFFGDVKGDTIVVRREEPTLTFAR
jgi:hypothetical protein